MSPAVRPLWAFLQSVLLGLSLGLSYDLLRPLRLRWPRLTAPLDALYALGAGFASFLFLLRRTEGELRAFLAAGTVGGAILFFSCFSSFFRPLWAFWAETFRLFGRFLTLPLRLGAELFQKSWKQGKYLFYFICKCYTIKRPMVSAESAEEVDPMKRKQQRPEKKRRQHTRSGPLTKIVILLLIAAVGWQLYHLSGQVSAATAQREALSAQVAQKEQENSALAEDIAEGSTVEKMKDLARSELDYVDPGEYVFEIIGAG